MEYIYVHTCLALHSSTVEVCSEKYVIMSFPVEHLRWVYNKLHSLAHYITRVCGVCQLHIWVYLWSAFDQNLVMWDNNKVKKKRLFKKLLPKMKDKCLQLIPSISKKEVLLAGSHF